MRILVATLWEYAESKSPKTLGVAAAGSPSLGQQLVGFLALFLLMVWSAVPGYAQNGKKAVQLPTGYIVGINPVGTALVAAAIPDGTGDTNFAQTPSGPTPSGSGQSSGFTIVPGANTPVYLKTIPGAVCKLREKLRADADDEDDSDVQADGDSSTASPKYLKLFSDADGNARFFVQPPPATPGVENDEIIIVLRCLSPGAEWRQTLKLRASDRATAEMPFPPSTDPALNQSNQTVLPPLSDPQAPTQLELLQAGYPARPDPTQNPSAYATWLSFVSNPINVVTPQTTPNSNLYYAVLTDRTGGVAVTASAGQDGIHPDQPFVWAIAEWQVPTVTGETFRSSRVGEWLGLDGLNTGHIVQAGTGEAVLPAGLVQHCFLYTGCWSLSTYDAWVEIYPYTPAYIIPSVPVHPGDVIGVNVWIGADPHLPYLVDPSVYGKFALFQIANYTTGQMISPYTSIAIFNLTDFTFTGRDAEWIVERPSVGPSPSLAQPTDLANYHSQCNANASGDLTITNAIVARQTGPATSYSYNLYNDLSFDTWNMVTGSTLLSYTVPKSNGNICNEWVAFH